MENVTTSKLSNKKAFLITSLIIFITVSIIVLAMPNTEKPQLSYTLNEPWMSSQLISPGEILIQKDPKIIEQEQKEVLRNEYLPYYNLNSALGRSNVGNFMEKLNADIHSDISGYTKQVVEDLLTDIYEIGILPQDEYAQMYEEDSLMTFMLVTDNQARRVTISELYSTKKAYETLLADKRINSVAEELKRLNVNDYIQSNVTFDSRLSNQAKQDLLAMVPTNSGIMKQGQEIINRGEIVTEEKARMIDSYNDFVVSESQKGINVLVLTNIIQWFFVSMLMILLMMYLQFFRKDYLSKPRSLAMVFFLLTFFPVLNSLLVRFDPRNIYILPLCLVPMFIRVFLDSRTAFMAHSILVLICAAVVPDKFEFIIVEMTAGIVAICALRELSKRSQIFLSALFITISSIIAITLIKLLGNKEIAFDVLKHYYLIFIGNGTLLLLTYPLMFVVEKTFGFISPVTLFELSDTNRDLLRKLSEVAPGTFQHSIMVSNLAAAIATEVGAKSLLVRTGALYHDIGKMVNPVFFTENQANVNPHTRMQPQESAQIIIGHVAEGVRLAEKHGIPDVITNFIHTHHGNGMARYFYNTYCNMHPDEEVDDTPFRYSGPNPFSREQAILMMADTVEAASRSLNEYTEESISNLVNRLINNQISEGYFQECPITFRDIAIAKRVLIEKLKSIYHTRIQYPELKK